MKYTFNLIWSDYFDGQNLHCDAAISLLTASNDLWQLDTGCPVTFISYEFALEQQLIDHDYIKTTLHKSINEYGDTFYFIENYVIKFTEFNFLVKKCYLEEDKTKEHKKATNQYWNNKLNAKNKGYLGCDFILKHVADFDFKNNILSLTQNPPMFQNQNYAALEIINNTILVDVQLPNIKVKAVLDTGSCSSGLILHSKFRDSFNHLRFKSREITRDDFIASTDFASEKMEIKIGHIEFNETIKIEFVNDDFNNYMFSNGNHDAILGLQFLKNYRCIFDFENKRFLVC